MFTRFTFIAATALMAPAASAETTQSDVLFDALGLPQMIEIMRTEGLEYGEQIGTDLLGDRTSPAWDAAVSTIYDTQLMETGMRAALGTALADSDVDNMIAFFGSDQGQSIVALEVSARRALLDEDVEDASKEAAAIAAQDETERFQKATDFIAANSLIEANVAGALNANFAFYLGLMDGGTFTAELTEDQIIADVWAREDEIRQSTTEWVYAYLLMAYQPLSDDDLDAYIAFSQSEAGQDLNTAMFAAFDEMYISISRGLGQAASQQMAGADL